MITNLVVGCLVMIACLAIQCVAVEVIFRVLLAMEKRQLIRATLVGTSALLTAIMAVMLVGTLLQISVWAGLFVAYGEFADFGSAFYHSTVNFATLGYGDLVMSEERRLLGALEALNGVLMIGLTTGVLFAVFNELLLRAWRQATDSPEEAD